MAGAAIRQPATDIRTRKGLEMATGSLEKRYSPVIILLLVAALVAVVGLWAMDRAGSAAQGAGAGTGTDRASHESFEWKLA